MPAKSINVSVSDQDKEYIKLVKIVPYNSGGFALVLPKLNVSEAGRLEKTHVDYENYGTKIRIKRDVMEQFSVNDIVKFSYHSDGFVQFSSATNNRIRSGRRPDGSPKGLGLLSWPLNNPVSTVASMTITFWGLSGFKKAPVKWIDDAYLLRQKRQTHTQRQRLKIKRQ